MHEIILSEETKELILQKVKEQLDGKKNTESEISVTTDISMTPAAGSKPKVYITPLAYCKMMLYIRDTSTEIAWHGTVSKNEEKNSYCVKDVFLYPQELSAATVVSDDEKYPNWLEQLDDETFNTMRFQGHSHVNFAASPSSTDMEFYKTILNGCPKEDFYIFMIMNKSGSFTLIIYDLKKNRVYENEDIELIIGEDQAEINLLDLINAEKELFCKKKEYVWKTEGKSKTKEKSLLDDIPDYEPHWWEDKDDGYWADNPYFPKTINKAKTKRSTK